MKKAILSFGLFLFAAVAIQAQEGTMVSSSDASVSAEMVFENEVIDYGTINKGANGVREFKFTNTGQKPLVISNAKGSCGCTVPSWPKEPINPGKSGVIKVKYDTKRVGPINKSVTVTSNASKPTTVLRIKGNIVEVPTTPVKETVGAPTAN